jgi:hypothetical protein
MNQLFVPYDDNSIIFPSSISLGCILMRLFVHRENVKYLAKLLQETKDPARREVVRRLLADEEEQLAKSVRLMVDGWSTAGKPGN